MKNGRNFLVLRERPYIQTKNTLDQQGQQRAVFYFTQASVLIYQVRRMDARR
jgi:hypothetical protein